MMGGNFPFPLGTGGEIMKNKLNVWMKHKMCPFGSDAVIIPYQRKKTREKILICTIFPEMALYESRKCVMIGLSNQTGGCIMGYQTLRKELRHFYLEILDEKAVEFNTICREKLDACCSPDMPGYELKALQYRTITDMAQPILFRNLPFYFELGTMGPRCDGCGNANKYHCHPHAGGWVLSHNQPMFQQLEPELLKKRYAQGSELLYLICGTFGDEHQHFVFNMRPVYQFGLKGLYERASQAREGASEEQLAFLDSACAGLLCLKDIGQRFAAVAEEKLAQEPENENYRMIAQSAARTPWNAPETFYEALNACAFLRTVLGSLEGVGYNTFGRLDVDLYPFYEQDVRSGRITEAEAYDLICKFLLIWDCHYDHDSEMVGYADHELENTYTLGGCDRAGNPVFNDLTRMFLQANREEKIIFPKIKCRFSSQSPKEYLDEVDQSVIRGTSTVLFENDDAVIPAWIRAGRTVEEARDYVVTGCWGMMTYGTERPDNGNYVNLLKPFEFSVHNQWDKMEKVGILFDTLDEADSFEAVYRITCGNFEKLFRERIRMQEGRKHWHRICPVPLTSVSLEGSLENRRDYTNLGTKYNDEQFMCVGFPNIVDSLLAIKKLCFDEKRYTLKEMLTAVRQNWQGYEMLRADALKCPGWGDGQDESCQLAARLNHDLASMLDRMKTAWGGKILLGHLTYTEIRFWGERTLATPDGRFHGDYFSQGLTPSRLHKIDSVTSVIRSMQCLNGAEMGGNNVINVILPSNHMSLEICEAFLRTLASSAVQCLQLNCTTREELLDAQEHPEKHQDLIIRVCGFSAKFTSLSVQWQNEILTRNFYQ